MATWAFKKQSKIHCYRTSNNWGEIFCKNPAVISNRQLSLEQLWDSVEFGASSELLEGSVAGWSQCRDCWVHVTMPSK